MEWRLALDNVFESDECYYGCEAINLCSSGLCEQCCSDGCEGRCSRGVERMLDYGDYLKDRAKYEGNPRG